MMNLWMRLFGRRLMRRAMSQEAVKRRLDVRFGFALLRDRRVPLKAKLLALAAAIGLVALLVLIEVPLESVLTLLVPLFTIPDMVVDGLEVVVLPAVLVALVAPFCTPAEIRELIRAERHGVPSIAARPAAQSLPPR
jgi:hypothetical protein